MLYRMYNELNKKGSFALRDTVLNYDQESPVAETHLNTEVFPDFAPKFSTVHLTPDSSLVDFIDDGSAIGGKGLMISEKVLDILKKMKLPPHRHYPLEVVHKKQSIKGRYFWLQILLIDNYKWIDYSKSEFRLKDHMDFDEGPGDAVRITSAAELKKIIEEKTSDFYLLFDKITLNDQYSKSPYDLFYLNRLGGVMSSYPYITERLKKALEREGVTGYMVKEVANVVVGT